MSKKMTQRLTAKKESTSLIHTLKLLTKYIKKSIIRIEGIYSLVVVDAKAFIRLLHGSRRIFVNISSKLRPQGQKERAIMRRSTLKGRTAAIVATFAVALGLAACGGGGGSDTFATVPTPAPVTLTPSWNNAPAPTSAGTEAAKQFAAKAPLRGTAQAAPADPYAGVDPFNAIEQLLDFGEESYAQYFPDHRATAVYEKFRYRYYPTSGIYLGVAYGVTAGDGLVESGVYVTGGEFGNSPTHVGTLLGFITPAVAMRYANWNGTQITIYPMGTKVYGANQLPAGCNSWQDQCWRDAVANGTVKFIATPARMTGYSDRPVVFAYFRNTSTAFGMTGLWNVLPLYADDGSSIGADIFGGMASEIDMVVGTPKGFINHEKSVGKCYEVAWNESDRAWDMNGTGGGGPVPCP